MPPIKTEFIPVLVLCRITNYIIFLLDFFFLILKEIKTFLWVSKSALDTVLIVPSWKSVPPEHPPLDAGFCGVPKRTKAALGELSSLRTGTCSTVTGDR